jgi:hypothetical protein
MGFVFWEGLVEVAGFSAVFGRGGIGNYHKKILGKLLAEKRKELLTR